MGHSPAHSLSLLAILAVGSFVGVGATAVPNERQSSNNIVAKDTNMRSSIMDMYARAPDASPVTFNYTLNNMSPVIDYKSGWKASVADSITAHTATAGNSFFTIDFVGTGIYFVGQTRDPTDPSSTAESSYFQLVIESSTQQKSATASSDSLLIFLDKLEYGFHQATFSTITGTVSLSSIKVLTQMSTEAPNFEAAKTTEALLYDGTSRNPSFDVSGNWYTDTVGGNSSDSSLPVLSGRAGAAFTYSLPANTSYVVLNGVTQPNVEAPYTVSLSPDPLGPSSTDGNAKEDVGGYLAQYYVSPLDPTVAYNLSFSVGSGTADHIGVRSIVTYSAVWSNDTTTPVPVPGGSSTSGQTSPSSTGSTPGPSASTTSTPSKSGSSIVGPVVGGVVGGVAGLLLIALAIFLYLRRKRRVPQPRHTPDENFVIDDDVEGPTPYPYEMTEQNEGRHRMSHFSDASTTPLANPLSSNREPVQGYIPSPASPTLTATTATTTNMLGLGLVNRDDREELATDSSAPTRTSLGIAAQKRAAALRANQDPFYPPQERDAGRWDADAEDAVAAMKTVPPSYDPSWAGDYSDVLTQAGTVVDDPSAGPSGLRDSLLTNDSGARRDTLHDYPVEELSEEDGKDRDVSFEQLGPSTVTPFKTVDDDDDNDIDEHDTNNRPKAKP